MTIIDQPGELTALYGSLFGSGARHAAAGLALDVLLSESREETIPGRSFLTRALGRHADPLLHAIACGRIPATEELIPFLRDPYTALPRDSEAA